MRASVIANSAIRARRLRPETLDRVAALKALTRAERDHSGSGAFIARVRHQCLAQKVSRISAPNATKTRNWRDPRTRIAAHQVTARERNVRETSAERREPVRLAYLYALSSAIVRDRSARIGLFQSVGALALGGHPDSALTAQFIRPRALGMALAHPAETDPAVRVDHETSLTG